MCTVLVALKKHPKFPFVVMANRDEFLQRPTKEMHWWEGESLLAGKDLEAGGTWLGLNKSGRFAVVTNVRDMSDRMKAPRSRGELVTDFVTKAADSTDFHKQLTGRKAEYAGYNLLFGDINELIYQSNKSPVVSALTSGIHGVSNAALNTPWPKVEAGRKHLDMLLSDGVNMSAEALMDDMMLFMQNEQEFTVGLPDTGIGEEWERKLSALYINAENYGTRVTTLMLMDDNGNLQLREFNRRDGVTVDFEFSL